MTLNMETVAPDRVHNMEVLSVVIDSGWCSRGTDTDGNVHDAMGYFYRRQGAEMQNG